MIKFESKADCIFAVSFTLKGIEKRNILANKHKIIIKNSLPIFLSKVIKLMDSLEFALKEYFVDKRLINVTHSETHTQHTIYTQLWSGWTDEGLEESEKLTLKADLFF